MSQVLSSVQYVCFRKTCFEHGGAKLASCPGRHLTSLRPCLNQRRIFIFGALDYFKLGAFLEDLRRLMSDKLALHVLAAFTEQVVPVHTYILF